MKAYKVYKFFDKDKIYESKWFATEELAKEFIDKIWYNAELGNRWWAEEDFEFEDNCPKIIILDLMTELPIIKPAEQYRNGIND